MKAKNHLLHSSWREFFRSTAACRALPLNHCGGLFVSAANPTWILPLLTCFLTIPVPFVLLAFFPTLVVLQGISVAENSVRSDSKAALIHVVAFFFLSKASFRHSLMEPVPLGSLSFAVSRLLLAYNSIIRWVCPKSSWRLKKLSTNGCRSAPLPAWSSEYVLERQIKVRDSSLVPRSVLLASCIYYIMYKGVDMFKGSIILKA